MRWLIIIHAETRRRNIIAKEHKSILMCSQQTWNTSIRRPFSQESKWTTLKQQQQQQQRQTHWNGIKLSVDSFIVYRTPCIIITETTNFDDNSLHKKKTRISVVFAQCLRWWVHFWRSVDQLSSSWILNPVNHWPNESFFFFIYD